MRRGGEVERLELRDGARRLVDGVGAELRHRAVRRHALEARVELHRALVPDVRVVRGRLADQQRARLAQELGAREMLRADAAAFFRSGQHNHQAWRPGQSGRKGARREQDRGHAGLHVGSAAPKEAVALGLTGESVLGPGARAERDGVEVPGEAERRLCVRSAGTRDQAGAARLVFVVLDPQARFFEQRAGMPRAIALAAGRVDRVEGEERPGKRDGVGAGHGPMILTTACSGTMTARPARLVNGTNGWTTRRSVPTDCVWSWMIRSGDRWSCPAWRWR